MTRRHPTILFTLLTLWFSSILVIVTQECDASSLPFLPQTVKRFVTNRCHNPITPTAAIWSWEGHLVDPSNGNVIANVEGIELVRIFNEMESPLHIKKPDYLSTFVNGIRRLHDLKVAQMLLSDRNWEYAGTVLSRKLFCYSPVSCGDDDDNDKYRSGGTRSLLKQYKLHPNAPTRKINTDESIALFDTATTFVSRSDGKEMQIITEWPDGRWVESAASAGLVAGENNGGEYDQTLNASKRKSRKKKRFPFAYTVYIKRYGKGKLPIQVPMFTEKTTQNNKKKTSIPRSKFIQFGKDEDSENHRYGARESYTYLMDCSDKMSRSKRFTRSIKDTVSSIGEQIGLWDFNFDSSNGDGTSNSIVQYVRYGEAPPFYAPGKMCTLELVGKRVDSVTDAPPLAATLAATRVPGFMSVHTPIASSNNVENSINAIKWFRGNEGSLPLQVLPENDDLQEDFVTEVANKGLNLLYRVRAATTLTAATEK